MTNFDTFPLKRVRAYGSLALALLAVFTFAFPVAAQDSRLVTGKKITPVGINQNVGSLPMNIVLSPNGKYAITSALCCSTTTMSPERPAAMDGHGARSRWPTNM